MGKIKNWSKITSREEMEIGMPLMYVSEFGSVLVINYSDSSYIVNGSPIDIWGFSVEKNDRDIHNDYNYTNKDTAKYAAVKYMRQHPRG